MYKETRFYSENEVVQFRFPFNKNLTKSFFIGTSLVLGLISLLVFWEDIQPEPRAITYNVVPLTVLNFGRGDGTGLSKGNLSAEGAAHKGVAPDSKLHDAEIASQTKAKSTVAETDPTVSSNIKAVTNISSDETSKNNANIGSSARNVGLADGTLDGTGLGQYGSGRGLGEGFGEIDWGGGGNRVVLSKKPPKFPVGVNTSGEIKIRFYVKPDGTVSKMLILKKADPNLENAALVALKQWRFNPIKDTIEMVGEIPFRFKLK